MCCKNAVKVLKYYTKLKGVHVFEDSQRAAGGVIASTPALMQLMARIDKGTKVDDILKPETIDIMCGAKANMVSTSGQAYKKYALGWRCNYTDYPTWTAFHGGTLAGVATIWARANDNVNGVILCN